MGCYGRNIRRAFRLVRYGITIGVLLVVLVPILFDCLIK